LHENNLPIFVYDFINKDSEDEVIAQVDRYGFPYNTVINKKTGIVRVSPYYSEKWLERFYNVYYRPLYTNDNQYSKNDVFQEQMNRGNDYYNFLKDIISNNDSILEIGCGMGGILFPFKLRNFKVKGIDFGEEFVKRGREVGLNLTNEDIDVLIKNGEKYDLIILSHLLEHIVDVNTFINKIKCLLSINGRLFISVPGIKNIQRAYESNFLLYLQNAHAWHFSQNTLKALLISNGFKVLKSDEEINCLVEFDNELNGDQKKKSIENLLDFEYQDTISYLLRSEEIYQNKQNKQIEKFINNNKSILDKSLRDFKFIQLLIKIKNKII
jgi:2-polyprenyl-3-methyl-5-hydroxy-6-metoxy-1,4-benzoquinol methylase